MKLNKNDVELLINNIHNENIKNIFGIDINTNAYSLQDFVKVLKFSIENDTYSFDNLTYDQIFSLSKTLNKKHTSLLFTWLYENSSDKSNIFDYLLSEDFNRITILNNAYKREAEKYKYRKSSKKKHHKALKEKKTIVDINENDSKEQYGLNIKNVFSKDIDTNFYLVVSDILKRFKNNKIIIAEYISLLPFSVMLEKKIDEAIFKSLNLNYHVYAYWFKAINYYIDHKESINKTDERRIYGILLTYILMTDMLKSLGLSDIEAPANIGCFKGAYFVSTPLEINKRLPISLLDFISIISSERSSNQRDYNYRVLVKIKAFFDYVISRKESFNIFEDIYNPISEMDLPKITRKSESNKVRLPTEVFWCFLSYTRKIVEIIDLINKKILNKEIRYIELEKILKSKKRGNVYIIDNDVLDIIGCDNILSIDGKIISINTIRKELLSFHKYRVKNSIDRYLINPLPIIQVLVALETGLRHQSIQWLSKDFDMNVPYEIDENSVYPCFIKTDKSKETSWVSQVSGRVIKSLRSIRDFNSFLDYKIFDESHLYENADTKWGKYKLLMNFNTVSGLPYSDTLYNKKFKALLYGVDDILPSIDIRYELFKNSSEKEKLISDITPHSTRVMVVSELINYLPPEYISRHITGHSVQTVSYYTKMHDKDMDKLKKEQIKGLNSLVKCESETHELLTIRNDNLNSDLVIAFQENPIKAVEEYGCSVVDENIKIKDLLIKPELNLSYSSTHICPYNGICPKEVIDKGIYHKCHACPYAIRSVDHLPAICAKSRQLLENIEHIENDIIDFQGLDNKKKIELQNQRKNLVEELATYSIIRSFLDSKLNILKEKHDEGMYSYKAKSILKKAYKSSFSSGNNEYLIERMKEIKDFPELDSDFIRSKIKVLTAKIMIKTGNERELIKNDFLVNSNSANCYSLIKTVMALNGINEDKIFEMINNDGNMLPNKKE